MEARQNENCNNVCTIAACPYEVLMTKSAQTLGKMSSWCIYSFHAVLPGELPYLELSSAHPSRQAPYCVRLKASDAEQ